jgi:hypothetical protein
VETTYSDVPPAGQELITLSACTRDLRRLERRTIHLSQCEGPVEWLQNDEGQMSDNTTNRNGTSCNSGPSSRPLATPERTSFSLGNVTPRRVPRAPEVAGGREHGEIDATANLPDYPDFESLLAASSGGPGA